MSLARQRTIQKLWYLAFLLFGAMVFSAVSLKFFPRPFIWLGLVWTSSLLGGMFCLRGTWARAILFNASIMSAIFVIAEAFPSLYLHGMAASSESRSSYFLSDGYVIPDDLLGSVPVKEFRGHSTKSEQGVPIYDVDYTIDSNGLRIAPPVNREKHSGCIVFFGCSFTFGEGVHDNETVPYQVGVQSGGQYRTFNFGFHGYGPHQMLAQIEHGIVRRAIDCKPDYAIYQALPDHVERVAGKVSFGDHAPHYQLDADGSVRLVGHFEKHKKLSPLGERIREQLYKSVVYRTLSKRQPPASEDDVRLTAAVIGRSKHLLEAEYPGIKFHVILWQSWKEQEQLYRKLRSGLDQMKLPVHLVEDILPDYSPGAPKYVLSSSDRHPSALADRILAHYVLTRIILPPALTQTRGSLGWLPASALPPTKAYDQFQYSVSDSPTVH
jgi:hypothetical protein